jgi:hypothetical protein
MRVLLWALVLRQWVERAPSLRRSNALGSAPMSQGVKRRRHASRSPGAACVRARPVRVPAILLPRRSGRSRRPGTADERPSSASSPSLLQCPGVGLDVCTTHREQCQAVVRTPADELAQVERIGVAGRAPIAGKGQLLGISERRVVDDHRSGRFMLRGLPARVGGTRGAEPALKSQRRYASVHLRPDLLHSRGCNPGGRIAGARSPIHAPALGRRVTSFVCASTRPVRARIVGFGELLAYLIKRSVASG